jgi:predicted alpha/beta hydrolase family esterase
MVQTKSWEKKEPESQTKTEPDTFNVLIIHGCEGYPQKHWYGSAAEELRAQGHHVVAPQFPTRLPPDGIDLLFLRQPVPKELASFENQTLSIWLDIAKKATEGWKPERTILVGHSLGGLTVLRLAEWAKEKPYHAVLAASPVGGSIHLPETPPDLRSFYEDINGDDIRTGSKKIIVFIGSDDSIVPPEQSKRIARLCRSDRVITIENGGHLNADSGYVTFPRLLQELEEITRKA